MEDRHAAAAAATASSAAARALPAAHSAAAIELARESLPLLAAACRQEAGGLRGHRRCCARPELP
eukprot:4215451-Lingulodinium_polyedra.AAC.1